MIALNSMEDDLRNAVIQHAARPEVLSAVTELYARVGAEIAERRPRCDASGECCRFDAYGHRLYVTTVESIAFAEQLRTFQRLSSTSSLPILANDGGACVFQVDGLCGVHAIRPFGCRMFYCDPDATSWQNDAYERYHAELKRLHERFGVPYLYVEWRRAVETLQLSKTKPFAPARPAQR